MGSQSDVDIKRLRTQARRLGIAIRKQRATRASPSRAYRLVDRDTGRVIYKDVALDDVRTRLWWIMRERHRATITLVPGRAATTQRCPSCGRMRIASFRWCTSCGHDYEAAIKRPLDPGAAGSLSRARSRQTWAPVLYLVGIAGADAATRSSYPWVGLSLYAVMLVAGLNQAAVSSRPVRILLLAVALVSVERLLGFTEPIVTLGRSYAYVAVAVPTIVGIALIARLARYRRRDLGLLIDGRVIGISLALTLPSLAVGFVLRGLIQPVALANDQGIPGVLMSWTVLALMAGLVEEVLFRGLIQRAASDCLGPLPGILYVGVLYTLLASAAWNAVGIAVVFTIAVALAALTTYTRSVVPAAAAHVSLNAGVLLAAASVASGAGLH